MGARDATGEKHRCGLFAPEMALDPAGDRKVMHLLITAAGGTVVKITLGAGPSLKSRFGKPHAIGGLSVVIPTGSIGKLTKGSMIDFPSTYSDIAIIFEVLIERDRAFESGRVVVALVVLVDAGRRRMTPRENRRPGGIAKRSGAMGAAEIDTLTSEVVDVWRYDAGIAAEAADPIVEIIDGKEQHIALGLGGPGENIGGAEEDPAAR